MTWLDYESLLKSPGSCQSQMFEARAPTYFQSGAICVLMLSSGEVAKFTAIQHEGSIFLEREECKMTDKSLLSRGMKDSKINDAS